ncbi:VanZ family protein [Pelomonas sp. KK5]|uniref:VanZ family protein n=1 Tax=Pelomonas sp. KK5 TaxID=1855730 RepID=UPI00097C3972|nr:VanZ family protein [Pelomonas sp. KK5]
MSTARRRSSATWLLLAYLALVVYASLYPFEPWTWPPGLTVQGLVLLPWPKRVAVFDMQTNIAGYMPLGLLAFAASLRSGAGMRRALVLGLVPWPLLSWGMECLQYFLPGRVPSLSDLAFNTLGTLLGVLLGLLLNAFGGLQRWQDLREYWFQPQCAGALALLALWPLGLLFPPPVPLGLGQWLPHLRSLAIDALQDTPWALQWDDDALQDLARALPPGLEAIATALGLLTPVLLALAVSRPGWRRLWLVSGAAMLGVLVSALSTVLNFGPLHAWAWLTEVTWAGLALGALLGVLACLLPRRLCAALGLVALSALIALVSEAPADPYMALSLHAWEQGRFVNMYGLAQWIGWVWPFAALGWLLPYVGRRTL